MKKLTITSILALCMACPAMANIDKDASTATCDSNTIGTTTGPANLQADWTANTITLDYYSGDTKVSTGSCSYDGGITLPSDPTPPTGYEFTGWKIRRAAAPTKQCWEMNQQECINSESCVYSSAYSRCLVKVSNCEAISNETNCDRSGIRTSTTCFWNSSEMMCEEEEDLGFWF